MATESGWRRTFHVEIVNDFSIKAGFQSLERKIFLNTFIMFAYS